MKGRGAGPRRGWSKRTARSRGPTTCRQAVRIALAVLAVAALCAPCRGADVEAEVTVRAPALRATERKAPTAYSQEIDTSRYAEELKTVTDALADIAGVSVRRYGGLGAFATLSVRGAGANQVQIFFDGIPLSRARNEVVDLADLPIDSLARIEVYRGVTPVNFSVAGLGGAVNLVPKRDHGTQAQAGYGSFDTRKATATDRRQWGEFHWLAHVAYTGSAGNFRFRTDNDTPQNPLDDRDVTRVHNSFDSVDVLLNLQAPAAGAGRWEVLHENFWRQTELPGRGANPSLHAEGTRLRVLDALRITFPELPFASATSGAMTGYSTLDRSTFRDPFGELGGGQQDRTDLSWAVGADGNLTWDASEVLSVAGLLGTSHEWFWPDNDALNAPEESPARRWRTALALQPELRVLAERLTVVPGFRWEHLHDATDKSIRTFGRVVPRLSTDRDLVNPSLGLAYHLGWGWTLLANTGRYQRAPSLLELFGLSGTVIGNPSLVPESAWNRDIGVRWQIPAFAWFEVGQLEYAYFDNDVRDLVVFVQRSAAMFRPENIGQARLRGHEVGLQMRLRQVLRAEFNYTLQDAENRSRAQGGIYVGKQLPGRPRQEGYARVSAEWGRWEGFYEWNAIAGNYLDLANFQRVPARTTHGLGLSWHLGKHLRLLLQVRNLTGNQISDVGGFPLPGRSWIGTVTWTL